MWLWDDGIPGLVDLFSDRPRAMYAALIGLLATNPLVLAGPALKVVPAPSTHTSGDQVVCLSWSFAITVSGDNVPVDLESAVKRTEKAVKGTMHTWLTPTAGSEFFSGSGERGSCASTLDSLTLSYDSDNVASSIFFEANMAVDDRAKLEEYTLHVPAGGQATLRATNSLGLFRGLSTFEQLFYALPGSCPDSPDHPDSPDSSSHQVSFGARGLGEGATAKRGCQRTVYTPSAPVEITDKPAFPWRSVMLDTSRNYLSKDVILKQLDAMAFVKLNVFNWHITDAQSWPMKLDAFPELAKGAYSPFQVYTQSNIQEIIKYAGERGIDVVVEVDTPAHTTSIGDSHPDFIACVGKTSPLYAAEPPTGQLRFANDTVTQFVAELFKATADVVSSKYLGTGGDELNTRCMDEDEPTAAILKEKGWTLDNALDVFTNASHNGIRSKGRIPVVWQEMVLDHNLTSVAHDTVVNVWISSSDAKSVVDKGYRVVHASSNYFYLDCGQGGWFGGAVDSWCDPFKSWFRMYEFDPYENLSEDQHTMVLGGQVSMWAEQTDESNLETQVWPRAAALAEILWSGRGQNANKALARMHDVRYRLVAQGIRAVPLQPHWCALRDGQC